MTTKEVLGESEEKREAVEKVKRQQIDADALSVEESTRDPSSPISDSSCQTTVAKPMTVPGRTCGPTRRSTKGGWTEEEDEILARAVEQFKGKNWKKIAEFFPGRSDVQCLHRWQKVLDPELVKGAWTKEEDERIIELVNKYGPKKWAVIARKMPGRIGKQCRERWHNHLNPAIKKGAWTTEEEITLIRAHQIYGNKWAEIAKFLPGRADNSIKNHWNCAVKKKLDSYLSSGLLGQLPQIAELDLNSNPADTENTKGCITPNINIMFGQKQIPSMMVNTSANLLPGFLGMPKEDPSYFNELARPIIAENHRNSKEFQGSVLPLGPTHLEGMTLDRRCSTYSPPRENSDDLRAPDCASSLDGSERPRSFDGTVPNTPVHCRAYASVDSGSSRLDMTKEVLTSPERFNRNAQIGNIFSMVDTKNVHELSSSAELEDILNDRDKIVNYEYDTTPHTPALLGKAYFNHDFYDPIQLTSLAQNMNEAKTFEPANSMPLSDSSLCSSAPAKLSLGTPMYLKDPKTILRDAAKSFENMPSIMRKRCQKYLGPSLVKKHHKDHASAGELCDACNSSGFACACQHEAEVHGDSSQHVRQLFPSPSSPLKSKTYDVTRLQGKILESEFDMECNGSKTDQSSKGSACAA